MKATIAIAWLFLVHECKMKSNVIYECSAGLPKPLSARLRPWILKTPSGWLSWEPALATVECAGGWEVHQQLTRKLYFLYFLLDLFVFVFFWFPLSLIESCSRSVLFSSPAAQHYTTAHDVWVFVFRRNQANGGHKATVVQGCLSLQGRTPLFSV